MEGAVREKHVLDLVLTVVEEEDLSSLRGIRLLRIRERVGSAQLRQRHTKLTEIEDFLGAILLTHDHEI